MINLRSCEQFASILRCQFGWLLRFVDFVSFFVNVGFRLVLFGIFCGCYFDKIKCECNGVSSSFGVLKQCLFGYEFGGGKRGRNGAFSPLCCWSINLSNTAML